MNRIPPSWFEPIREKVAKRWEQLRGDPELAAPWDLLFKQIQYPHHVVSELLQNADDAGAQEVSVRIVDRTFLFQHDGNDFTEEDFASLCRFGYSNKRTLHTIGFRGIGFKSAFSLGNRVELFTPTLSVGFHKDRFSEPEWINDGSECKDLTTIRVTINDVSNVRELEKNLREWFKSPISLLFFKHLRRIRINDEELHWNSLGPGPNPEAEWLAPDRSDHRVLLARSPPEPFPEESLAEIREERRLNIGKDTEFPPCVIEIALGIDEDIDKGRLFVVLPTGIKTVLPFACNAPFIQDPARLKIKAPERSPTNRWLLRRIGSFVAELMLEWLCRTDFKLSERARAYGLMPDVDRDDRSLEGICGTIVEESFEKVIEGRDILLTDEGRLTAPKQSIIIPRAIFDIWSGAQATTFFDKDGRPVFSRHVSGKDREKLLNWSLIEEIDKNGILAILQNASPPKPKGGQRLLSLWSYIAPIVKEDCYSGRKEGLHIVPVQGKDFLRPADEVIRLGEKKLLPSAEDWQFLGARLSILQQSWPRYLKRQQRIAETNADSGLSESVDTAYKLLEAICLHKPSDPGEIIRQFAVGFFGQEQIIISDAVRMAQIAAKLKVNVGEDFLFVSHDPSLRSAGEIIYDVDGTLESLLPEKKRSHHLLHTDYSSYTSCTLKEWREWVSSGSSGLHTFFPPSLLFSIKPIGCGYDEHKVKEELTKRSYRGDNFPYRYPNPYFTINDRIFNEDICSYWETIGKNDDTIWSRIAEKILDQPSSFWSEVSSAEVIETARNGHINSVISERLVPAWILKLRRKKCLRDTHGTYRKPEELFLRTRETEALVGIELFIDKSLDKEASRPLLELLGVSGTPMGPDKLLDRLQTLAGVKNSPVYEIENLYSRLDQMIGSCSTVDLKKIKDAFGEKKLILTESGAWVNTSGVFLSSNEEDVPGAETVRASLGDLMLWRRVGIADRPTAELVIKWLQGLPSGELSPEDLRRIRALLKWHPTKIRKECGHWLSLSEEWTPWKEFTYALPGKTQVQWEHLYPWVKQKTADLRGPSPKALEEPSFEGLSSLADHIEERFDLEGNYPGRKKRPWLTKLGEELQRIELDDPDESKRIRERASRLALTEWQKTKNIEITPYIDGQPAGTPRQTDVKWDLKEKILYLKDRPIMKLARSLTRELAGPFSRTDIEDAIKFCFDRSADSIASYMEENFKLIPREELETKEEAAASEDTKTTGKEGNSQVRASEHPAPQNGEWETRGGDDPEDNWDAMESPHAGEESQDYSRMTTPQPSRAKLRRPGIMERFALSLGFVKEQENRFVDTHGNRITKTDRSLFSWERLSASDECVCYYLPLDYNPQDKSLLLDVEIWNLLGKAPEPRSLIFQTSTETLPVEFSGARLYAMLDHGDLILHPASYRLVFKDDQKQ